MTSCFQKLTFLLAFEKCWCPICSMQTHCSEHLCGTTCSWDLPCKHIHELSRLLATLSSGEGEERELNYVVPVYGREKGNWSGSRKLYHTAVVCCCQDPSLPHDRYVSPPWKAVFLSFQSCFVCRVQPHWICLVLAHRKQVSMCNKNITWRNFRL